MSHCYSSTTGQLLAMAGTGRGIGPHLIVTSTGRGITPGQRPKCWALILQACHVAARHGASSTRAVTQIVVYRSIHLRGVLGMIDETCNTHNQCHTG